MIAHNISSALANLNYCGPLTVSAYGDTTRIPTHVQHALSSTGIALNHVPAGVKDASDKKILVDMLFWAVDNPAPANYLLISGDRDFSNALHQLRMRRYNILLAQPNQASAALVAAAQCVWHWTSLVSGKLCPLITTGGDRSNITTATNTSNPAKSWKIIDTNSRLLPSGSQYLNQAANTATRMPSLPVEVVVEESDNMQRLSHGSETVPATKQFMKAPHEFFRVATSSSNAIQPTRSFPNLSSATNLDNYSSKNSESVLLCVPHKMISNNTSSQSFSSTSDDDKLSSNNISSKKDHPVDFSHRTGEDSKSKSMLSLNPSNLNVDAGDRDKSMSQSCDNNMNEHKYVHSKLPLSSLSNEAAPNNNVLQNRDNAEVGLIGVILRVLNILRVEKIAPTAENISNCIRYGDPKFGKIDVMKALKCALEQQMIVKQRLGKMELYVGRIERLWRCENPAGGNVEQYPDETWHAIQKFLTSSTGKSAMIASECRYEAALILKKSCLKAFSLGEVFRILNMTINMKKWINHAPHLGWQPVTITISETDKRDMDIL